MHTQLTWEEALFNFVLINVIVSLKDRKLLSLIIQPLVLCEINWYSAQQNITESPRLNPRFFDTHKKSKQLEVISATIN